MVSADSSEVRSRFSLDLQLSIYDLRELCCIRIKCSLDLRGNQLLDDLRTPADKRRRISQSLEVRQDWSEEFLLLDALQEVVRLAFLLHYRASLVRENPAKMSVDSLPQKAQL